MNLLLILAVILALLWLCGRVRRWFDDAGEHFDQYERRRVDMGDDAP